jgi:putative membrane-bound dehydrogenase-like protein
VKITPQLLLGLLLFPCAFHPAPAKTPDGKTVAVLVAGKPSHGPGEHEFNAGIRLLEHCLNEGVPDLVTHAHFNAEWPGAEELAQADTLVIYCDGGEQHLLLQGERMADVDRMMARGAGLVVLHYAVELPAQKGGPEALRWLGGYFEANWSVNPIWHADFAKLPVHPVTSGVKPFAAFDEWYFHLRFNEQVGRLTPILVAVPPASTMSRADGPHEGNPAVRAEVAAGTPQTMAWIYERANGGRSFGYTGGHYHNGAVNPVALGWGDPNARKLVLNAIVWTAKLAVPPDGVASTVTADELAANLDRKPRKKAPLADSVPVGLFTVPPGFEVTLWASSPLLHNPTNLDIDAQGRIWVTEGINYRKHRDRQTGGDKVVVLEDTTGSGRADRATTFIQEPGLITPLGMAVIDNQVIVSNAPDLIVYTRAHPGVKFDPRVDKREVLLTGFNGRNHDHSLHSVTFGPDGKWYFSQGNSGAFFTDRSGRTFRVGSTYDPLGSGATPLYSWKPEDISGSASDDGHVYVGGFTVRMNPNATHAEIIGYNYRNSYEQCLTSFGDVFQNDNDDPPACRTSFLMEYGNAGYFSRDGLRTWQADKRPGQTTAVAEWRQEDPGTMPPGDVYGAGAPTGIVSYESDQLGKKWRGMILSADAARNTVLGYFPAADGAGYRLEHFNFLTTNREEKFNGTDSQRGQTSSELKTWFRPSDVAVGPDGAIYVADWFDPRVGGHADLDNHTAGSIYRIAPVGFKSVVPALDLSTTEGQISALKSPAINVRASGFLRLKAQGGAAIGPVAALLDDENPFVRARAIWLLAQMGQGGLTRVEAQLHAGDPMVRLTAYRALRRTDRPVLAFARSLAADPSPAVRREVALSMRDVPLEQSGEILVALAGGYDGRDRAYLEAWGTGCSGKEAAIYAALDSAQTQKDPLRWSQAYANLIWRLTPPAAAAAFAARAESAALSAQDRVAAVTALAFMPTAPAAQALLDLAEKGDGVVKVPAFWWLLNYQSSRWKAYGVAASLKARGLYDPDRVTISSMTVPVAPVTQLPPVEAIARLTGDSRHGAEVARACMLCHRIGAGGVDYAPNLTGFANRQTREVIIEAIRNPSADIAHGYEGTELVLKDGKVIDGLALSSGDPVIIESTGGFTQTIPANRIRSRRPLNRSLMLSADQLGLSAQDLADVAAYLKTQN